MKRLIAVWIYVFAINLPFQAAAYAADDVPSIAPNSSANSSGTPSTTNRASYKMKPLWNLPAKSAANYSFDGENDVVPAAAVDSAETTVSQLPPSPKPPRNPGAPATQPTPTRPTTPGTAPAPAGPQVPGGSQTGGQAGGAQQPFGNQQASASTAAYSQRGFAPNMIGDLFSPAASSLSTIMLPVPQTTTATFTSSLAGSRFDPTTGSGFFIGPPVTTSGVFALPSSQPFIAGAPGSFVDPTATGQSGLHIANGTATTTFFSGPPFSSPFGTATLNYTALAPITINIPSPSGGGNVGTMKIAENSSPIPRDRVYINYSYFNGVPLSTNGVDVNRITPGFEKTFFNGLSSIEVRAPFASTLSNTIYADGATNTSSTQFGDLTLYLKHLFYRSETFGFSGGLGMALPTGNNVNVYTTSGQQLVAIKNESVHLLPFIGSLYTPNDRAFVNQFLQTDYDTNGNTVETMNPSSPSGSLVSAGRQYSSTYLYYSIGAGYWLYNEPQSNGFFTRISPIVEMHYNQALYSQQVVSANGFTIGTPGNSLSLLNGTFGATAQMGTNKTLTLAYTTPLAGINDRQFDGELRVLFNWFFGGSVNRQTRVQF